MSPVMPSQKSVDLVPGSLTGMRSWRVDQHTGNLLPISVRSAPPWEPGENQSRCFANTSGLIQGCTTVGCAVCGGPVDARHTFSSDCDCGFYGVWRPDHVPHAGPVGTYIVGVIKVYGRMVIGPQGFRAAKAEVLAFAGLHPSLGWDWPGRRFMLADKWQDIPMLPDMVRAAREFPLTNPMDYLDGH